MESIYSLRPEVEAKVRQLYQAVTPHILNPSIKEISANYDPLSKKCLLYFDDGTGPMQPASDVLAPEVITTVTLLLTTGAGKSLHPNASFLNCVLPNGARYHAALPPVSDGPSFSLRLHHPRPWKLSDFEWADRNHMALVERAVLARKTL